MWIILTAAAAAAGGLLLLKCRVPGGMLVGAIIAVAALSVTTGQAYMWPQIRVAAQVLTGAYIGCMVTREDICHLPKIIGPYLTVMGSFFLLNLAVGTFIYHFTSLDLLTSLLCAMPGGMSDTPLIAMDMGADSSVVAVMQFVRMLFGMGCLPSIVLLSDRLLERDAASGAVQSRERPVPAHTHVPLLPFLPTLGVALCAGLVGRWSGIPAGAMSFSMVAVAALKIAGKTPPMPMWLRRVAQVISGCCIGSTVGLEQLLRLRQMVVPAVVLCLGYILCCVGMGWVISRVFHLPPKEAMLSLSPAGATEMALIAADLGVESTNLVVLQICRLIGVMLLFPQLFSLLLHFLPL